MARQKDDSAGGDAVLFERLVHYREADWASPDEWDEARKAWGRRARSIDEINALYPSDLVMPPTPDPREERKAP